MRPGYAALVVGTAAVLGGLSGAYALPAGGWSAAAPPASSAPTIPSETPTSTSPSPSTALTPTASPSSPSPTPTATPTTKLTAADLLSTDTFTAMRISVTSQPVESRPDPTQDATRCVPDEANAGIRTLQAITGHKASLGGWWEQTDNGDMTHQVIAVTEDAAEAKASVDRLVASQQWCKYTPPKHWVYAEEKTQNFSSTRSVTWFGAYPAEQNEDGHAPEGVEPCGGTVFARNGARFTVLTVSMCLDDLQLSDLAAAASERLG